MSAKTEIMMGSLSNSAKMNLDLQVVAHIVNKLMFFLLQSQRQRKRMWRNWQTR